MPGPGPVQLYVKAWGRPGDTAMIALVDGFPVGAAWFRLFKASAPGYGFVDERRPELAVAVVPNARGKGVGSALLRRCSACAGATATRRSASASTATTRVRSRSTSSSASNRSTRRPTP